MRRWIGKNTTQQTVSRTKGTMAMLDYRFHYAVMVTEDRIRSLHDEASLRRRLRDARPQPKPRPTGHRRWRFAGFVGLLVPSRDAR